MCMYTYMHIREIGLASLRSTIDMAVLFTSLKRFEIVSASNRFKILTENLLNQRFSTMSQLLDKVADVDIDGHGRFKYILINVYDEANNKSKSIVRGYARAQWHDDIFGITREEIKQHGSLRAKCLGGGRIEHDPDEKTIKVYGYSQGFGKADHEVSVELLKKKYPEYSITWSDDGY